MTDIILKFGRLTANVIIVAFLLVTAVKIVWNVGLAYAMIREDLRQTRKSWSAFPLVEVVPLLGAIGLSLLIRAHGLTSAGTLATWGFVAIVASYVHLAFILGVYGLLRRRRQHLHPKG